MKRLLLTLACLGLAASAPAQMRAPSTGINARFLMGKTLGEGFDEMGAGVVAEIVE